MYKFFFFILILLNFCCFKRTVNPFHQNAEQLSKIKEKEIHTIAFGSCNRQYLEQPLWPFIAQNNPQCWIWLGDNIYADTEDMTAMAEMYEIQKNEKNYQSFARNTAILGTWDDHDYGVNDGGKEYPKKEESKDLLFDFLNVPLSSPAWNRPAAYQQYIFGPLDREVKLILLDCRSFRDQQLWSENRYIPNPEGDILGEAQWQWLESALKNSQAEFHIIASGIQIIAEDHRFEKWANFPKARTRLFDLISQHKPKNLLLLSGDRHIAEFSKINLAGYPQEIFDFTSSGLTHSYTDFAEETNRHRDGRVVSSLNFGLIMLDWSADELIITLQMRGLGNRILQSRQLKYPLTNGSGL